MSLIPPPPTYAEVVTVDPQGKHATFSPVWLDWFLTVAQILDNSGGASGLVHNSMGSIQGGTTNEYYHMTSAEYVYFGKLYAGTLKPTAPYTVSATPYTVTSTIFSMIFSAGASVTVTLPAAVNNLGRLLLLNNNAAFTVISASSDVVPITGGAAGTAILAATSGKFALLQSDGSNWITLMAN